jgi:hypothetical protein
LLDSCARRNERRAEELRQLAQGGRTIAGHKRSGKRPEWAAIARRVSTVEDFDESPELPKIAKNKHL